MKIKQTIILVFIFLASMSSFAQTATNFNVKDCDNNNYDLFSRLDSGKVVVIAWVMPCATCIGPAATAYAEVQNLVTSNPGKIDYLLVDDFANTQCSTLKSWGVNYGITAPTAVFSDAAINMNDYGTGGMPKIAILCGPLHAVVFNENDGLNNTAFKNALNGAIQCAVWPNTIIENMIEKHAIKLAPNPSTNSKITIDYTLPQNATVTISFYSLLGKLVAPTQAINQISGRHSYNFSTIGLAKGIYFASLEINGASTQLKFIIQ